jgi:hypothetical protein
MALKQAKALELECMAIAQGRNLVATLFQAEEYAIKTCVLENLNRNILSDSQAVIKVAMQDAFFIIKST